jgi:RHS repeat-associated protein
LREQQIRSAASNTVSDGRFAYVYDARNRLGEVWSADGTARLARYAYNALGQRALKVAGTPDDTDYLALALEAEARADGHRTAGAALEVTAEAKLAEAEAKDAEAAAERVRQDQKLAEAAAHLADEQQGRSAASTALAAATAEAEATYAAGVAAEATAAQAEQASLAATARALALRAQAAEAASEAAALEASGEALRAQATQWQQDAAAQETYAAEQRAAEDAYLAEAEAHAALERQRRAEAAVLLAEAEPALAKARFFRAKIVTPPKNPGQRVTNLVFELLARFWERRVKDLTDTAAAKNAEADQAHQAMLVARANAAEAEQRSIEATAQAIALRAQAAVADQQATVQLAQAEVLNAEAAQASAQASIQEQVALQQRQVQDAALAEAAAQFALEADIRTNAAAAYAQASAEADVIHALALAAEAAAAEAEQRSIAATNAAIELRAQAAEATEQAAEQYVLADAVRAEADHYRYLAENPPNTEEITLFAFDAQGHLIGEYDETGAVIREHVWLDDSPLATFTAEATYHIQADHLNTPVSMTDGSGAVVWQATRSPFGETSLDVSDVEQNLRFPGQYFDQETGLNQNWWRDHDPGIGRYIQADPLGVRIGPDGGIDEPSLYAYVANNPLIYVDPKGLLRYVSSPGGRTDPLAGDALAIATCTENCLGRELLISGGSECTPDGRHIPGGALNSRHCPKYNQAFDVVPNAQKLKTFCCAFKCGADLGLTKSNHWHFQKGGNKGTPPETCECKREGVDL